ncbi:src substrate protein p85-like isoform X1 [Festucalex cinctus]
MWKSAAGHNVSTKVAAQGGGDDDWETDPDFENDVSEQEQRWGAKTVPGSGHKEPISVSELRAKVAAEHEQVKHQETTPKASYGYGGKFGVETDHVDKIIPKALGANTEWNTRKWAPTTKAKQVTDGTRTETAPLKSASTESCCSDYLAGFGGRYGVQKERMDKSAVDFSDTDSPVSAYEKTQPIEASAIANAGKLKALFESLAKADNDDDNTRTVQKEKSRRKEQEKRERQEAEHKQQEQTSRDEQLHLADVPQVLAECQSSLDIRHNTAEEAQAQLKTCDTEFLALLVRSDHFLQPDCRPPPPVEDVYRQVTVDDEYEVVAPTPPSTAGEEQQVCTGNDINTQTSPLVILHLLFFLSILQKHQTTARTCQLASELSPFTTTKEVGSYFLMLFLEWHLRSGEDVCFWQRTRTRCPSTPTMWSPT